MQFLHFHIRDNFKTLRQTGQKGPNERNNRK